MKECSLTGSALQLLCGERIVWGKSRRETEKRWRCGLLGIQRQHEGEGSGRGWESVNRTYRQTGCGGEKVAEPRRTPQDHEEGSD